LSFSVFGELFFSFGTTHSGSSKFEAFTFVVEFEVTAAFAVLDTPSRAISVTIDISSKEAVGNR